ncbi:MAG: DNA methyltransferase [Ignavibacteriaceae bacterium]
MNLSFIKSSGNIISEDFCIQLAAENRANYVSDNSFGITKVNDHIALTFEALRDRWENLRSQILDGTIDNAQLRDKWLKPFFTSLDFNLVYNKAYLENGIGEKFNLSNLGWSDNDAPVVHIVSLKQDLDKKDSSNKTHKNKSPHDMLQNFLNHSNHKWAILTNGLKFRILRDFHHSITKGFIEFDLEGIFETGNSEQFRALFRLAHKSRFAGQKYEVELEEIAKGCLLEKFYELSRDTGVEIGKKLRNQVRNAIEILGNGFVEHLGGENDKEKIAKELYNEILNIIYRILFLLFAEQKGWLPIKNDVYANTYSVNALRNLVERGDYSEDTFIDLWEGLKITFNLVTNGYKFPNGDEVNAFGGQLFSDKKINLIKDLPLKNKFLLKAIYELCYFENEKIINRINYTTLDINALGSVYESLLDYEPKILTETIEKDNKVYPAGSFFLDDTSFSRKTTGSYFTDSRLVALLIDSALKPVIAKALENKSSQEEKEKAILDLNVCDMACGSGAFLIAALETLGNELAIIKKGEEELPTDEQLREAKRLVVLNCIYGVDLNPMAVELCKFSLWVTASMPNLPLVFLDHKIKSGNSLIGATPDLIKKGIPPEAFNEVTLDDKEVCTELKKVIRKELDQISRGTLEFTLPFDVNIIEDEKRALEYLKVIRSPQLTNKEIKEIEDAYSISYQKFHENIQWKLADTWTSAFFIKKDSLKKKYPTNELLYLLESGHSIDSNLEKEISELSEEYKFFHWHLEFPEVFEKGGFNCILGNPPWEKVKLQDREFFKSIRPDIANATKNKRLALIEELKEEDSELYKKYSIGKSVIEKESKFLVDSQKYPLMGRGDVNTYMVFTELAKNVIGSLGMVGIIVPSGVATQDTTKVFFSHIVSNKNLISIYDFENTEGIFHDVHRNTKFCLLTICGGCNDSPIDFLFNATNPEHLNFENRHFSLTSEELFAINPNTGNCPVFSNKTDADIVKKIYCRLPVLINDNDLENGNPWRVKYYTMFHMSNDSGLFKKKSELETLEFILKGNIFKSVDEIYLPLYEGKMIDQYNHRYSSIESVEDVVQGRHDNVETPQELLKDSKYVVQPRFWVNNSVVPVYSNVPSFVLEAYKIKSEEVCKEVINIWYCSHLIQESENELQKYLMKFGLNENSFSFPLNKDTLTPLYNAYPLTTEELNQIVETDSFIDTLCSIVNQRQLKQFLGFRDITNSGSERTSIFSIIPNMPTSNKLPIMISYNPEFYYLGLANFNSIIFDFVLRNKMGGNTLNLFILKQLPIIDPDKYNQKQKSIIKKLVLELTYTAYDLKDYANYLDYSGEPFTWDTKKRLENQCMLDAIYFQLYGITKEEMNYIFETFPGLKKRETEIFGSFRTKETILKYYDEIELS